MQSPAEARLQAQRVLYQKLSTQCEKLQKEFFGFWQLLQQNKPVVPERGVQETLYEERSVLLASSRELSTRFTSCSADSAQNAQNPPEKSIAYFDKLIETFGKEKEMLEKLQKFLDTYSSVFQPNFKQKVDGF